MIKPLVLVDRSPSTRTAAYQDDDTRRRWLNQLLPGGYVELAFGQDADATTLPPQALAAPGIVLLSDGQLAESPAGLAPVFAVIDPVLAVARDAAVTSLRVERADAGVSAVGVSRNAGTVIWAGGEPVESTSIGEGLAVSRAELQGDTITLSTPSADAWPENDSLTALAPPPPRTQRWWASASRPAPAGFTAMPTLPHDPAAWLAASVVVIDNLPADAVPDDALATFARDAGGGVVLLGGDRAFAAGEWQRSAIDALSPLASLPPQPKRAWVLLADASGSMARGDRWPMAVSALLTAGQALPAGDAYVAGHFNRQATWWADPAAPPIVQPTGATNLDAALRAVAQAVSGSATDVLVITDGEAELPDLPELLATLRQANVRVHVMPTAAIDPRSSVRTLVADTGGILADAELPQAWPAQARRLLQQAMLGPPMRDGPIAVALNGQSLTLPRVNRIFARSSIEPLAIDAGGETLAARWGVGAGQVTAVAWQAEPALAAELAEQISATPADPRFEVSLDDQSLTVRAFQGATPMTDAQLAADGQPLLQQSPGVFAFELPRSTSPRMVNVTHNGAPLKSLAVAGRYPAEFDRIGVNEPALMSLAASTGGRMVRPEDGAIDLPRETRGGAWPAGFALAGAGCIVLGLFRSRSR